MVATALRPRATEAVAPIEATIEAMAAARRARHGEPPVEGVLLDARRISGGGWRPASDLLTGRGVDDLLAVAGRRWNAPPHVAAALLWKCYAYWVALPAVVGYGVARRVPLPRASDVLVRACDRRPVITIAMPEPVVAALPEDPVSALPANGIAVVPDEATLLAELRTALIDDHLGPMLDALHGRVRLGRRTLLGSLASGVAHGVSRAASHLLDPALTTAENLLAGLGLTDLVELTPQPGGTLWVQRQTCCLAFALPAPKLCRGCCIRR